jgi:hypothetical protein
MHPGTVYVQCTLEWDLHAENRMSSRGVTEDNESML